MFIIDSKNALQIAALSMIFPPVGRIRYKKVHWKASTVECQESLINLVPVSFFYTSLLISFFDTHKNIVNVLL